MSDFKMPSALKDVPLTSAAHAGIPTAAELRDDMRTELAALRAEINAQSIALGDEIVALRAEVEGLRGALGNTVRLLEGVKRAGWVTKPSYGDEINLGLDRARQALGGTDA